MTKKVNNTRQEEVKKEPVSYVATFGLKGREVSIECKRTDNGGFVGLNGDFIPDWAVIKEK